MGEAVSHTALVKFAPVYTLERHNNSAWNRPGRALYTSNALRFKPGLIEVPLLINHQDDHRIGTVTRIFTMDWTDGPWWVALATIDGTPPAWMRRYDTKCSFRIATYARGSFTDAELVRGALVSEVSVLSPGTEPAEPLAQVLSVRPTEMKPAISRAVASAVRNVDPSVRHAQEDAARRGVLYRPAIGQVPASGDAQASRGHRHIRTAYRS